MLKPKPIINRADLSLVKTHCYGSYYKAAHGYWRCTKCDAYLHHIIYGKPPVGYYVDHRNGDKDNNTRSNLRLLDYGKSAWNRKTKHGGLRGTYRRNNGRWGAKISYQKRQIPLGTYDTEAEAHEAYLDACEHYYGELPR